MNVIQRLAACLPPSLRARIRDSLPSSWRNGLRAQLREGSVAAAIPPPQSMSEILQWGKQDPPKSEGGENAAVAVPQEEALARLEEIVAVCEVDQAEFFVGDLFRRRFNTSASPDYPRHFVAFYKPAPNTLIPVGYVHQSTWEGCHLCGGLVIDDRLYRRMAPSHRKAIRDGGGIAELLLRESFARVMPQSIAIWGYVGDKQAEQVDLRVGFIHTHHPHVMVIWNRDLDEKQKTEWINRVVALGPF